MPNRTKAVVDSPLSVSKAYKEAVIYGRSQLELEPEPSHTTSGPIGRTQKRMLTFLNGCEKNSRDEANDL